MIQFQAPSIIFLVFLLTNFDKHGNAQKITSILVSPYSLGLLCFSLPTDLFTSFFRISNSLKSVLVQARWYRKIIGKYLTIEVFGLKLAEHILLNLLYNLLIIHLVGSPAKSQTEADES